MLLAVLAVPVPAGASCAAPVLQVAGAVPTTVPDVVGHPVPLVRLVAGQDLAVVADGLGPCDGPVAGSGPSCEAPREPAGLRDVDLLLVQGDRRQVLATADAGRDGVARFTALLPADLRPGRAVLLAGGTALDLAIEPAARR